MMSVKDIFLDALEIADEAERRAFIDRCCATDPTMREAVEALFGAHHAAATLRPVRPVNDSSVGGLDFSHTGARQPAEQIGDVIGGRYELIRSLGEGGFGVVFLARQREPVVRDVALKLLKGGLDSGQIVARFAAERQTLARMDHPQIARVFDAGTTERGRPYFVMEYVAGMPITTYCNEHKLSLRERLHLMEQVCAAVQHAHLKGVIHRDLKPGNILVTPVDGQPVPKVIDFGISKAIVTDDDPLGLAPQATMTLEAQIIGTPQYMAPEQATLGQRNVDTRSDVYSLGTVVYELITGGPPFDSSELRRAGLDDVCRIIRERVPPRPSTRLASGQGVDPTRTTWNGYDLSRVARQVAGEIDWIVMRAIEKEPARRYQSAADLGADIARYLRNEPVAASPPSRLYAMRKFVRRHRIEVAAGIAVLTALIGTAIIASVKESQARRSQRSADAARVVAQEEKAKAEVAAASARESETRALAKADEAARQLAKANAIADFTRQLLGGIGPSVARGRDVSLLKDLLANVTRRLDNSVTLAPAIDLSVRSMIGKAQFDSGDFDTAIATLRPAYDRLGGTPETADDPARLRVGTQLGSMLVEAGRPQEAVELLETTIAAYARRNERDTDDGFAARIALGSALLHSRRFEDALRLDQQTLNALEATGRGDSELTMVVTNAIAAIYRTRGEMDRAIAAWQSLLRRQQAIFGDDHPGTLATMSNLAFAYHDQKRFGDAERLCRQILTAERALYEPTHPNLAKTLNNLGAELLAQDKLGEAEPILVEAERIAARLPPNHRYRLAVAVQMMNLRTQQKRFDESVAMAYRLRDTYIQQFGPSDVRSFASQTLVLGCLADAGRFGEALKLIESLGSDPIPETLPPEQRVTFNAACADVMRGFGRLADARAYAATARANLRQPEDGSAIRIPPRLLAVEAALSLPPTTAPTSRPIARLP